DLLMLSRVAVPEMVIIFFELLIYFVILSERNSRWQMSLAGFLLFLAAGMKATIVFFLLIFSILILLMPRPATGAENRVAKWRDLALFWAGFSLPIVAVAVASILYLSLAQQVLAHWNALKYGNLLDHFLRLQNFYTYSLIRFPFEDELAPTFNVWALGLWISALAWVASGKKDLVLQERRYLVTSALWFGLYL